MKESLACGNAPQIESPNLESSDVATVVETGGHSITNSGESPPSAEADSPASAEPAATPAPIVLDGWRCVDFTGQTGHAVGRSAQLGDLQICVTCGDGNVASRGVPMRVIAWLIGGDT